MTELAQFILAQVEAAGGEMLYPDLYNAVEPEQRRKIPNAKKELKAAGLLSESIVPENGVNLHKLTKVQGA